MKFPARGKKPAATQWWDQVEDAPRAGLPEAEKMRKSGRKYRVAILASLFLLPIALLSNVVMFSQMGSTAPVAKVQTDKYGETRPVAMVAVREWLAAVPAPLPGGELVDWKSATARNWKPPADGTSAETPYRIETHHLTVSTPDGVSYTVSVPVGYDESHGGVALDVPALLPDLPTDDSWRPTLYPDNDMFSTEEPVEAAIMQWADAYTSGDPALLRQAIGDKNTSRSYVPLSGARLREVSVGDAYIISRKKPAAEGVEGDADLVVVRVTAGIDWATAPIDETDDAPLVAFDVLVDEASTAAPVVVAWGGPGSGLDLEPFSNGTSDREVSLDLVEDFEGEGEEGVEDVEPTTPVEPTETAVDPNEGVETPDATGGKKGGKKGKGKNKPSTDDIVEGETAPDATTEGDTQ